MKRQLAVAALGILAVMCAARAHAADEIAPRLRKAIQRLGSGDENARHNAALDIANMRSKAAPALEEILKIISADPSAKVRRTLLRSVAYMKERAVTATDRLLALLADRGEDVTVRAGAAFALGSIGDAAAKAVPDLIRAAGHHDTNLKQAALRALGEIGPKAAEAVPVIVGALSDGRTLAVRQAVVALGDIGPAAAAAAPALIAKLPGGDERLVKSIGLAVGRMGPKVAPQLAEGIASDNANTRAGSALALGCLEPAEKSRAATLEGLFADDESMVRLCAVMGLERMGEAAEPAVAALLKLLSDGQGDIRWRAVSALGAIGPAAKEALPVLTKLTGDDDRRVARSASRAIQKIRR